MMDRNKIKYKEVPMAKWQRAFFQPNLPLGSNGARMTACKEHILLSKEAAKEGMVLLKNDESLLPFPAGTKLALFGKATFDYVKGGGGSGDVTVAYTKNLYDDGVSAKANENDGYYTTYWLSSRIYFYGGETNFDFCLIHVPSMSGPLSVYCPRRKNSTEWADVSYGAAVRPIITLKHKVYKNMGQGTKGNPYIFK